MICEQACINRKPLYILYKYYLEYYTDNGYTESIVTWML
jgi:hypothetical protein